MGPEGLGEAFVMLFIIFTAAILVMVVFNVNTRGPDDGWWVLWPIQLWSVA